MGDRRQQDTRMLPSDFESRQSQGDGHVARGSRMLPSDFESRQSNLVAWDLTGTRMLPSDFESRQSVGTLLGCCCVRMLPSDFESRQSLEAELIVDGSRMLPSDFESRQSMRNSSRSKSLGRSTGLWLNLGCPAPHPSCRVRNCRTGILGKSEDRADIDKENQIFFETQEARNPAVQ